MNTYIYFDLVADDENETGYAMALSELADMLAGFGIGRITDEGHDRTGALVCRFMIESRRLCALAQWIERYHGIGDDGFCVGDCVAAQFTVTDRPGLDHPVSVLGAYTSLFLSLKGQG